MEDLETILKKENKTKSEQIKMKNKNLSERRTVCVTATQ